MAYAERLQASLVRAPSGAVEDILVMTMHVAPVDDTTPLSDTQRGEVESAWNTFLGAYKGNMHDWIDGGEYRWYEAISDPPNPPLRVTAMPSSVNGTNTSSNALPPQCSVSVTLETAERRRWGRFYLPITGPGALSSAGRLPTTTVDAIAGIAEDLVSGITDSGKRVVVFSRPSTPSESNPWVNPHPNEYLPVIKVRVDDIIDIQRRRRWESSPYRASLSVV